MTLGKSSVATIDEYIACYPAEVQSKLQSMRGAIQSAAPQAQEAISYGIPTFRLHGNLVHFAAFKQHIGFYPTPSAITQFSQELSAYKSAKGSVQFPFDHPLPLKLITKIVKFRAHEAVTKHVEKSTKKSSSKNSKS